VADVAGGTFSWGGADFGVSDQGVLAYRAGAGGGQTDLVWLDRAGKRVGQVGGADHYYDAVLSKDGQKVALIIGTDAGDIWLHDLGRNVRTRFTFDPADDASPVFSPDGTQVAFVSSRKGAGEIYVRDVRGSGEDALIFSSSGTQISLSDWSADALIFSSLSRETSADLWTYSLTEKKAAPWFEAPLDQGYARLSPDGRWIAYASYESGQSEIYVQSFPDKGRGRWQISQGGDQPRWRGDGKELYYVAYDGTMMAAEVNTAGPFDVGTPHPLFRMQLKSSNNSSYDPAPDGQRFLCNVLREDDRSGLSTTVVVNWTELLRR
jgi:Tol biopolymer transport system component